VKAYTILKILESLRLFRNVEEKSYVIPPQIIWTGFVC